MCRRWSWTVAVRFWGASPMGVSPWSASHLGHRQPTACTIRQSARPCSRALQRACSRWRQQRLYQTAGHSPPGEGRLPQCCCGMTMQRQSPAAVFSGRRPRQVQVLVIQIWNTVLAADNRGKAAAGMCQRGCSLSEFGQTAAHRDTQSSQLAAVEPAARKAGSW